MGTLLFISVLFVLVPYQPVVITQGETARYCPAWQATLACAWTTDVQPLPVTTVTLADLGITATFEPVPDSIPELYRTYGSCATYQQAVQQAVKQVFAKACAPGNGTGRNAEQVYCALRQHEWHIPFTKLVPSGRVL